MKLSMLLDSLSQEELAWTQKTESTADADDDGDDNRHSMASYMTVKKTKAEIKKTKIKFKLVYQHPFISN